MWRNEDGNWAIDASYARQTVNLLIIYSTNVLSQWNYTTRLRHPWRSGYQPQTWETWLLVFCKRSGPVQTRSGHGFPRATGCPGPRVGKVRVPRSISVRSGPNPCRTRPGQTPTGWHGPGPVRSGPDATGWSGFCF